MGPYFDTTFWNNFWSQFAAGLASLIVGLPAALLVARWTILRTERGVRAHERKRLEAALRSLMKAIELNGPTLQALADLAATNVVFVPMLDTASWDAVKGEVTTLLQEAELQSKLANHFDALNDLRKLNDFYVGYAAGMPATLIGSEKNRDYLHGMVTKLAKAVLDDGAQVTSLLEAVIARRTPITGQRAPDWLRKLLPWQRPDRIP